MNEITLQILYPAFSYIYIKQTFDVSAENVLNHKLFLLIVRDPVD